MLPAFALLTSLQTSYLLPFSQWQYAIAHGLSLAEQQASYEQVVVPESKRVIRQALSYRASLDFARPHAPLLLLAGSADRIMPAALNYANYRRYASGPSITHYRLLPGRNHFMLGQPTWQEDAHYIRQWLTTVLT